MAGEYHQASAVTAGSRKRAFMGQSLEFIYPNPPPAKFLCAKRTLSIQGLCCGSSVLAWYAQGPGFAGMLLRYLCRLGDLSSSKVSLTALQRPSHAESGSKILFLGVASENSQGFFWWCLLWPVPTTLLQAFSLQPLPWPQASHLRFRTSGA